MTMLGAHARRLIDTRGGPGSGPNFGHPNYHLGKGGGSLKTGDGSHVAAGFALGAAAAVIEAMGSASDAPVDLTADSLTGPTEMQVEDLAAYWEAHGDLWRQGGALVVGAAKGKKLTGTFAKLTTPATGASRSIDPVTNAARIRNDPPRVTEYATESRRSSLSAFRPAWGPPPMSIEERASWLVAHCRAEMRLTEMRSSSRFRVLQIETRRFGPGEA